MVAILKNGFCFGGVLERTFPQHESIEKLIPDSIANLHEKWMTQALLEAMNAVGWASPNPAVGCVIVKDEKIIASGFTQSYGGLHAERAAFESLRKCHDLDSLSELTVYVTLEPCTHVGKQPACVDLLFHSAIKKVVIACGDPDTRVNGLGIQKLKDAGKEVLLGVLQNEARAWHFPFLQHRRWLGPIWAAKWAENQDGLLADANGNSKWITNEKSRAYGHWLRQKYDAILVGAGTWIQDQPKLTARDCAEPHRRNPVILIHDPKNSLKSKQIAESVHVFNQSKTEDLIAAVLGTDFGFELQSIFCEGGARTLNELFRANRIDVVHRFVGQKDFGASKHRIMEFQPLGPDSEWRHAMSAKIGNDYLHEWAKWS